MILDENTISDLHSRAVALAHEAQAIHDTALAQQLMRDAFDRERQAAEMVANSYELEPTRSILFRSAASLALNCKEFLEAERLIAKGLSGRPPGDIADELRDLLEWAHFDRHLALTHMTLEPQDIQLTVSGPGVAPGIAGEGFLTRVRVTHRIFLRIVQHIVQPANDKAKEDLRNQYKFYVLAMQPGSLAVTLKIGQVQATLPSFDPTPDAIEELVSCIDMFQNASTEELEKYLPDVAYRRDLRQLVAQIAPDGEEIRFVGVATVRDGQTRKAAITKRPEIPSGTGGQVDELRQQLGPGSEISGRLLYANELLRRPKIILLDDAGVRHEVLVRDVSMEDIVKPLWGKMVRALVARKSAHQTLPHLVEIFEDL
jgi:hypothetical protein